MLFRPSTQRVFLILIVIGLSACGFEPLHRAQPGQPAGAKLAGITIDPVSDRSGQLLRNYLLDRITPKGEPGAPLYVLHILLQEPRQTLALRRDDVISRVGYSATAFFTLTDANGRRVFSGDTSFATDYEVTNSEYATLMSAQAARERVLELVSDDIRNQLGEFLGRRR